MENRSRIAALLFNAILAINLLVPSFFINAIEGRSFSISPPNFEISANTSDKVTNTLKIENLSDIPLTFNVRTQNFKAYGDEGQVTITEEDSSYSINQWLKYNVSTFTVEAKKSYLLDFTIEIPTNAEPGSHFGAIVVGTVPPPTSGGAEASVIQEIGSLILIRLQGDVTESAELITFAPITNIFTDPKIKFNTTVENTGSVHFKMTPILHIYDIFGNEVQKYDLTSKNILPASRRIFDDEFEFSGFGLYNAKIELTYSSGTKTLIGETSFTSLYLQRSLPLIITLIVLVVLYFSFRKRINKALKILLKG